MKNYSSNRAQKGKTAFRTPSMFRVNKPEMIKKSVNKSIKFFFKKNKSFPINQDKKY